MTRLVEVAATLVAVGRPVAGIPEVPIAATLAAEVPIAATLAAEVRINPRKVTI